MLASAAAASNGFFLQTTVLPPRFLLLVLPPFALILAVLATSGGRAWAARANTAELTRLHSVRIGVEILFYLLFLDGFMPKVMTFEGRNLDMVIGISAMAVYAFGYRKALLPHRVLQAWNILGIAVLAVTVYHGIFSAPFPFQRFGFEQPNVALLYAPFFWVPSVIVPMVIFNHLAALLQLHSSAKSAP
ncbi:MAG: hypothetical protein GC205_07600 [Bacteroidetes bacterium]|nr:hypothetical protein [Bacteroidota bacterium]